MTTARDTAQGRSHSGDTEVGSMAPQPLTNHWDWRPDWTPERPHWWWYATFEQDATVRRLAAEAQRALRPGAPVDVIPLRRLHLSLAEVGYVGDIPPGTAQQHARAAQQALAGIGRVTTTVGPVSAMPGAIVLDVHAAKLDDLHERLVSALAGTIPRPAEQRPFEPHISVAYVRRHCTTDDVFDRAPTTGRHRLPDDTATTAISEITLVEVVRDQQHYRWTRSFGVALD